MKKYIFFAVLMAMMLALTSCQSREEKVLNKLDALNERIEKNSDKFDADDWMDVIEDLSDIHDDMLECDFSEEQLKKLGRVEGQLTALVTSKFSQSVGGKITGFLNNLGSYATGFKIGVEESFNEGDLIQAEEDITNALKSLEEKLNQ